MLPEELPIFPMRVVLFPGMLLPLHVFEDRYKAMIQSCIERRAPFGVVLAKSHQSPETPVPPPYEVGTTAHILQVVYMDDGKMSLAIAGHQRFRIVEIGEWEPYMKAIVRPTEDSDTGLEEIDELRLTAAELFCDYLTMLLKLNDKEPKKVELPDEPHLLSYSIATNIDVSLLEKQQLLEMDSVKARLAQEVKLLRRETGKQRAFLAVRKKLAAESSKQGRGEVKAWLN